MQAARRHPHALSAIQTVQRPIAYNVELTFLEDILLGAEAHACGTVLLTSGDLAIAISIVGFHVRDANTGELLWKSKGFAPRTCASAIASSGRIFCNPQVNGMFYCLEPGSE